MSLTVSPTALAFGTLSVGQTSGAQTATVTNVCNATVTISSSISIGGTNPSDFIISSKTCGSTLGGGANCQVSVEFKPTATGKRLWQTQHFQ